MVDILYLIFSIASNTFSREKVLERTRGGEGGRRLVGLGLQSTQGGLEEES